MTDEQLTETAEIDETVVESEEDTVEALIAIMGQRAATYQLLARLYRVEVDEEFLAELKGMRYPAATGDENVDKGYYLIAKYLSNAWDNTVTELAIDYVRVFIGHGIDAFSAAYPYESVYTSERRLMMQDARDEVVAIYRSEGLDKQSSWKENEDHLALELEFMQVLCTRIAEALEKGDEDAAFSMLATQKNFLEDHMLAWVPMMTSDMRKFAYTKFYEGLSYLTDGFLAIDFEFVQDLLD